VRRFLPPPIWMHLTLTILVTAACFFGGAFGGTSLFRAWSMAAGTASVGPDSSSRTCAGGAFFFGGAIVGLATGQLLVACCVPARCPKCGGRTYYKGGRPITYQCRDCRHIHATSVSDSKGGWGDGG
jgi:hypothetical protein